MTWPPAAKGATLSGTVTAVVPPGRPMTLARTAGPAAAAVNATAIVVADSAVAAMSLFMVSLSSGKRVKVHVNKGSPCTVSR